jgi:hypothetical protein
MRSVTLFSIGMLASLSAAKSQAPTNPAPAYSVGTTFDVGRGSLVLVGGYLQGGYVGEVWDWDAVRWARSSGGPSARNGPLVSYDTRRGCLVAFGGDTRADGAFADTWERCGQAEWRRVDTSGPPGRSIGGMVYDSRRGRIVMFGGSAAGGRTHGDTWEWDGKQWSRVAVAGPPPRALHAMAYDSARGRTVVFGGVGMLAPDARPLGDTWEWDGTTWTRVDAPGPSARDHTMMTYDPVRRLVVLHGGGADGAESAETWTFDGRSWTRLATDGPRRRNGTLVWDSRARRVLLYGGFDAEPSNEIWTLKGAAWLRAWP